MAVVTSFPEDYARPAVPAVPQRFSFALALFFGGVSDLFQLALHILKVFLAVAGLIVHAVVRAALCICPGARGGGVAARRLERACALTQRRGSMGPGAFIIVRHAAEWDVMLLAHQLGASEWLGYTDTSEDDRSM